MEQFLRKHQDKINGTLGCFDRMLFRGYLPIQWGWAMAQFLNQSDIQFRNLKDFLVENSYRLSNHAKEMAKKSNRPFQYLSAPTRKEDLAREMIKKDGVQEGLVCVFSVLEPCRTFSFKFRKGRPFVESIKRKCLFLYFYFVDRDLGLIHVKLQSWFPMQIQVYVNGHEWLARKLTANHIGFTKCDNVFVRIDDPKRAQKFADRFAGLDWPKILDRYAHRVNPLVRELLPAGSQYYWCTAQSEYSTDILFKSALDLQELYPKLLSHSTLYFGAKEVMSFLGRKLHGKFEGEIITDLNDGVWKRRVPGARVKHRVKQNWLKMYDKAGLVLRVETVINNPEEFKVRKKVTRHEKEVMEWVPMRKGVAYLFRYQEVSKQANHRYLEALAVVEDPTQAIQGLDGLTTRKQTSSGRGVRAFNPVSREDAQLFKAVMAGEHCIRGLSNADIRNRLKDTPHLRELADDPKRQSSKVSRILGRFHAHKLIAKIPHTRRWRVTDRGRKAMATSLRLREADFPKLYTQPAVS